MPASPAAQQRYLEFDVVTLERELEEMQRQFPELAEDEDLRSDMFEGETDVKRVLGRLADIALDAKAMDTAIGHRMTELRARRDRYAKRQDAVRGLAMRLMRAGNLTKEVLPEATISVSRGKAGVEIEDEDKLPKAYRRVTWTPNKTEIKEALDAGKKVRGAKLVDGPDRLTIWGS